MPLLQGTLFTETEFSAPLFPSTRYQGSKSRFIDWIWSCVADLPFETCLDAFGGTGCFAHKAKKEGKTVVYNDIQPFNAVIGRALVENPGITLDACDIEDILDFSSATDAPRFIAETFRGIYYTDEENLWLDKAVFNIRRVADPYKQSMAWFALFQSCLAKRPYNLFHRKNLSVRLRDVERSFGNKTTWDKPFPVHFRKFAAEANAASFPGRRPCKAICGDAANAPQGFDLVYIDTPYIDRNGHGVDYASFYHFLNGLVSYDCWANQIDHSSVHKKLLTSPSPWTNPRLVSKAFEQLFTHFRDSILAISYRGDGIPSIDTLCALLSQTHSSIEIHEIPAITYALSKHQSSEVLLVARP